MSARATNPLNVASSLSTRNASRRFSVRFANKFSIPLRQAYTVLSYNLFIFLLQRGGISASMSCVFNRQISLSSSQPLSETNRSPPSDSIRPASDTPSANHARSHPKRTLFSHNDMDLRSRSRRVTSHPLFSASPHVRADAPRRRRIHEYNVHLNQFLLLSFVENLPQKTVFTPPFETHVYCVPWPVFPRQVPPREQRRRHFGMAQKHV
jgi:hypothetical protein